MASEEDIETVGGVGGVRTMQTTTIEVPEGSGAEDGPGGAAAEGGATSDAISKDADAAGAGGAPWGGKVGK